MKNILSILVVSVFLFGCSKSGDSPNDINDTSGSILGSWDMITITGEETISYLDPIYGTEEIRNTSNHVWYDVSTSHISESWTFRYDNTYIISYSEKDSLGNITHSFTDTSNYEKSGDSLFIHWDDFTITTLNNSSLSIQKTDLFQWSSNDTTFLGEGTITYSFTKSINGINKDLESLHKKGNNSMSIPNIRKWKLRNRNR